MTTRRWLGEAIGVGVAIVAFMGLAFLLTGCKSGDARWRADHATMSTQFEFSWGTSVKIGFPGTVTGNAEGQGELRGATPPVTDPTAPGSDAPAGEAPAIRPSPTGGGA